MTKPNRLLHDAARLFNIQTAHYDGFGRLVRPPAEAILRVLHMLGAPVERMEDLAAAVRQRREFFWRRGLEPVVIAWNGSLGFKIRVPGRLGEALPYYQVALEQGDSLEGLCREDGNAKPVQQNVEGERYLIRPLVLPERLPTGYHRLKLSIGDLQFESYLISSAWQSYAAPDLSGKRWGLFCPLYALTSEKSWGAGDFSDLEALVEFVSGAGGTLVGTLPLLSAFLDEPFNPSPYAPASRLFWNEFYLDVTRIPEFHTCPVARAIANSPGFRSDLDAMRGEPLVDYRRLMALKRKVLEELLRYILNQSSEQRTSFERFVSAHPIAQDYAEFRAKVERERRTWEHWEAQDRDGTLRPGDYDENVKQYHLYVQWQAREQMRALGEKTKAGNAALYLDFPLGVNRDGYDVWRERGAFALEASGGAPPDGFFTKGQNWGFPPLHPDGLKRQGYRHYIHCLRHHLRYARMLRIDHIMGLHRLYWIPDGFTATEGVYVHYSAEEFYAILSLESHRHQALIIGENLGTVPPYVNTAMAKHGIHGMSVGQFGIVPDPANALPVVAGDQIASLNTHDTPTFYGFWTERDIQDRLDLGLLSDAESVGHRHQRAQLRAALIAYLKSEGWLKDETPDAAAVLRAWLCELANGKADLVLVSLEDLWLELLPQNVPGTWQERPNWQRKTTYSLEQIHQMLSVTETLKTIDGIRKKGR